MSGAAVQYKCGHSMQSWYIQDSMPRCHDCDDNAKAKTKGATVGEQTTDDHMKRARALLDDDGPDRCTCTAGPFAGPCAHCQTVARVAVALRERSEEATARGDAPVVLLDSVEMAAFGEVIVGSRMSTEQRVDRLVAQVGRLWGFRDAAQRFLERSSP